MPLTGNANATCWKVLRPPPPTSGVFAAASNMLNLPTVTDTCSPNFWVTKKDVSLS